MSAPPNHNKPSLHPKVANPSDDDDDLDDLDEVLDQFSPPAIPTASPKPSISTPTSTSIPRAPPPTATTTLLSTTSADDSDSESEPSRDYDLAMAFSRELQRGMESLMRDMSIANIPQQGGGTGGAETGGTSTSTKSKSANEPAQDPERAFKELWEAMLVQDMDGMGGVGGEEYNPPLLPSSSSTSSAILAAQKDKDGNGNAVRKEAEGRPDFQARIRAAVDKLKSSESGFKSPSSSSTPPPAPGDPPTDPLAAFLAQLNGLDGPGSGGGDGGEGAAEDGDDNEEDDDELRGMLELMMDSLMSKEVLYEPLKELGEKYPPYLHENATTLSQADKTRYETQLGYVTRILRIFEDPAYNEEDREKGAEVVELMGLMQTCGSPPTQLMGDLPPGFSLGADGTSQMPEGCCIS